MAAALPVFPLNILIVIFICSCAIAMCAWFYGIYEAIATAMLVATNYRIGKKAIDFKEAFAFNRDMIRTNEVIKTENGKFKFIQANICLFKERLKLKHFFRLNSPFSLKGYIEFQNGIACVKGRVPLGPTLFLVAWITGWTSMGILLVVKNQDLWVAIVLLLGGWGVVLMMYYTSLPLEKHRFLKVYEEIKLYLGGGAAGTFVTH